MNNWKSYSFGSILKKAERFETRDDFKNYTFSGTYSYARGIFSSYTKAGAEFNLSKIQRIKKDDFIFCKIMAWEGAFGIAPEECDNTVMSGAFVAYEIDRSLVNPKFLDYFFRIEKNWRNVGSGSTGTNVRRKTLFPKDFEKFEILLPTLSEQQHIITRIENSKAKLDEVKQLRSEQDKAMKNLRYSLMCNLENEFPKERIDVVCDLKKGAFPIMKTDAGEYPFVVTAAEFKTANDFDFDCEATCVPLVSSTGHGNAAMHRVHYASGKFALSNLLCAVMPKDKEIVNAKFLFELFMAKKDEYFVPIMAGTSNVSLNPGKLGAVEIPIPPIEEQNRIVELLEKINEIKQTHKEQEAELKQLMPSLLDKAFKGEL